MDETYEIEQWVDKETDMPLIKIRKFMDDGSKMGIILIVPESSLFKIAEGSVYPKERLTNK